MCGNVDGGGVGAVVRMRQQSETRQLRRAVRADRRAAGQVDLQRRLTTTKAKLSTERRKRRKLTKECDERRRRAAVSGCGGDGAGAGRAGRSSGARAGGAGVGGLCGDVGGDGDARGGGGGDGRGGEQELLQAGWVPLRGVPPLGVGERGGLVCREVHGRLQALAGARYRVAGVSGAEHVLVDVSVDAEAAARLRGLLLDRLVEVRRGGGCSERRRPGRGACGGAVGKGARFAARAGVNGGRHQGQRRKWHRGRRNQGGGGGKNHIAECEPRHV